LRACVTGATGLIGSALVRRLVADGNEVSALVRSPVSETSSAAVRGALAGVRVVAGDLANQAAVAEVVSGADVVFHLAAKVSDTAPLRDFEGANVEGTSAILEAAVAEGTARSIIYLSSIAVYGRVTEAAPTIDEETPLDPSPEKRDAYSRTKIAAEQAAVAIAQRTHAPLTIIRPGIVYGAGRVPPASLVGFSVRRTHVAFAQPEWHFPLVYVENLVDAIIAAAQCNTSGVEDFNIVDDDALTLASYHHTRNAVEHSRTVFLSPNPVLAAAAVFGPIASAITPAASGFSTYQLGRSLQDRIYDTKKIRAALNWAPRVSLADALEATFRSRGSRT
jgi:nucleoside-diphosphate-sugar epimerase